MNVRSLNKKFLALSVITFALLMQTSCGPEKPIRKVYLSKETYFKELNETLNDHHFLTPIKENDFHVVGNTNSIYDADVVVFGDFYDSPDVTKDFIRFANSFLRKNDNIIYQADSERISNIINYLHKNNKFYIYSNYITRNKAYNLVKKSDSWDDPLAAYTYISNKIKFDILLALESVHDEIKSKASVWDELKVDGWDKTALNNELVPLENFSQRNTLLAQKISEKQSQTNKTLVFADALHIPHYGIAFAKTRLMKEAPQTPTIKQMISTQSVQEFFKLCGTLPEQIRKKSLCGATQGVWSSLMNSKKKFVLMSKKKPEKSLTQELHKGFGEDYRIIREKNLVPNKL